MCLVEIVGKESEQIELNLTKVVTSSLAASVGQLCANQFIELTIDAIVYNICGNWSEKDVSSMSTFMSKNSSIIIRIHSSINERHSTHSTDINSLLGFCISFKAIDNQLCQPSNGWFEAIDYCYKVFHQTKNWFAAQEFCKSIDPSAELASITSPKVQKLIDQYLLELQNQR